MAPVRRRTTALLVVAGLLDVLDGDARFQVGLCTQSGTPAAGEPSARLETAARQIAARL